MTTELTEWLIAGVIGSMSIVSDITPHHRNFVAALQNPEFDMIDISEMTVKEDTVFVDYHSILLKNSTTLDTLAVLQLMSERPTIPVTTGPLYALITETSDTPLQEVSDFFSAVAPVSNAERMNLHEVLNTAIEVVPL